MQSIVNHLLATERLVAKGHIVVAQSSQFSARDFARERGDAKAALVDAIGVLDATQWARAHGPLRSIRLGSAKPQNSINADLVLRMRPVDSERF
jgi:hypothetical protein